MTDKRALQVKIKTETLEKLDAWREAQPVVPSRTATVEAALTKFLEKVG